MAELPPVLPAAPSDPVLDGFTERQKMLAQWLAVYPDQLTKCVRLAGYVVPGQSAGTAYVELAKTERFKAAVDYFRAVFSEQSHYTPEKIVHQLSQMADIDMTDAFDDDWRLKPKREWPAHLRSALTGLEVRTTTTTTSEGIRVTTIVKPRFARVEALLQLAKIFGLDKQEKETKGEGAKGTTVTINVGQHVEVEKEGKEPALQVGSLTIKTSPG